MKKKENGIVYETEATKIKKKRKRKKIRNIIIAGVVFILLALLVISRGKNKNKKKDALGATPVQVIKARLGNVSKILKINGEIQAKFGASIFSDVAGRVRAILKREGKYVTKGAALATIDRRSMGVDYLDYLVRSPISGVVGKVDVEVGYTIGPTTQLMKIVNPRFMECIVDLVEKDIGVVKEGMIAYVTVDAYPDKVFEGQISKISSIVHPLSRTVQARILIDNNNYPKNPLKDGMYANAKIVVNTRKNVTLVPYSAVLDNEGVKYLFVVKEKTGKGNKKKLYAEKRVVNTGIIKRLKTKDGEFIDFVEIVKGVNPEEFVVFMGHRFLQTNTEVEMRSEVGDKMINNLENADAFKDIPQVIKEKNEKIKPQKTNTNVILKKRPVRKKPSETKPARTQAKQKPPVQNNPDKQQSKNKTGN